MDSECQGAIELLCKKVLDGTVTENQIITHLAKLIEDTTDADPQSQIRIVINKAYGGFGYHNDYVHWYASYKDLSDDDQMAINIEKYSHNDSVITRELAASSMYDFGKFALNKHKLTQVVSVAYPYFNVINPIMSWTRGDDIEPYIQMIIDPTTIEVNKHKIHTYCQNNFDTVMSSIKQLAALIGIDNVKTCIQSFQDMKKERRAGFLGRGEPKTGDDYSTLPYGFTIYVFKHYQEQIQANISTHKLGHEMNHVLACKSVDDVIPHDHYELYGLYFASDSYCRLDFATVNKYRHWSITDYDGLESISYPEY